MKLSDSVISSMLSINYFEYIGQVTSRIDNLNCEFISSIQDATKLINGVKWENIRLENNGDITGYLAKNRLNQEWNKYVDAVKMEIIPFVVKKIGNLPYSADILNILNINIKYDIIGIAMSMVYQQYINSKFYNLMYQIYNAGHIPCGWHGKSAKGHFLIY